MFGGYSRGITATERAQVQAIGNGKSNRTVFPNAQLAHVWASQSQASGRSGNGNFYFEGATLFSYGSHFPVATFTEKRIGKRRLVLFTGASYSVTTAGHISDARGALNGLPGIRVVSIPDLKAFLNHYVPMVYASDPEERAYQERAAAKAKIARFRAVFDAYVTLIGEAEIADREAADSADWRSRLDSGPNRDRRHFEHIALERRETWRDFAIAYGLKHWRLPRDCGKVVADRKAAEKRDTFRSHVAESRNFARRDLAGSLAQVLPVPAFVDQNPWTVKDTIRRIEATLKGANRARYWLGRGHGSRADKARLANFRVQLAAALDGWNGLLALAEAAERFQQDLKILASVQTDRSWQASAKDAWTNTRLLEAVAELTTRVQAGIAAGRDYGDTAAPFAHMYRQAALARAFQEFDGNHPVSTPAWKYRFNSADRRSPEELREAWLNGESLPHYHLGGETIVRRKGERLETSRGAQVPFRAAVAVYVKAQHCRANGASWKRNGETMPVGSFQLDRIAPDGAINVGCHTIGFPAMTRLAVQEVPELVRPCFPLPVLIG